MNLGKAIKQGIKKKDMTQTSLGEKLGVGASAVNNWINGRSYPSGDKLIDLVNILDIQDEVFPRKKEEKKEPQHIEISKKKVEEELEAVEKDVDQLKYAVRKIADHIKIDIQINNNHSVSLSNVGSIGNFGKDDGKKGDC